MKRLLILLLAVAVFLTVVATAAAQTTRSQADKSTKAAKVVHRSGKGYAEVTGPYRGFTFYSELGAKLSKITKRSHGRVQMKVAGESAGGHTLWRLTVTWPMSHEAWDINNTYRDLLISNPDKAKAMLSQWFKVDGMGRVRGNQVIKPVAFINCSIHGGETTGVDAGLIILRRLAFQNDARTMRWLKNTIVVIDPCQNPDGRIAGTRAQRQRLRLQPRLHHADAAGGRHHRRHRAHVAAEHDDRLPHLAEPDPDRAHDHSAQPQHGVGPGLLGGDPARRRHGRGRAQRARPGLSDPLLLGHRARPAEREQRGLG